MKKLLLLAAVAATFASASAETFSDVFTLTYNDQTIADGQTITVDEFVDQNADMKDDPVYGPYYEPDLKAVAQLKATNKSGSAQSIHYVLSVVSPSSDVFWANGSGYGNATLCYNFENGGGQCTSAKDGVVESTTESSVAPGSFVTLDIDHNFFTKMDPVTFKLELEAVGASSTSGKTTVNVSFTHSKDVSAAVDGIEADSAAAEYYTLQGIRVAEPQKGNLYIVRNGKNVSKRIF